MTAAPLPPPDEEEDRIRALERYEVLDTPREAAFDRITTLASTALDAPIVLISLVDSTRSWLKSCVGVPDGESPREIAFCSHTVCGNDLLIVPDALNDSRFADNPFVVDEPHIRFYAGAPLKTPGGANVGTLCIIDTRPREFSVSQKKVLSDLAGLVVRELEQRKADNADPLTGAFDGRQFLLHGRSEWRRAKAYNRSLAVLVADLDDFEAIDATYGFEASDLALMGISAACAEGLRHQDIWARLDRTRFAALLVDANMASAIALAERMREKIESRIFPTGDDAFSMTASIGVVVRRASAASLEEALAEAESAQQVAREHGGNRFELSRDGDMISTTCPDPDLPENLLKPDKTQAAG